MTLALLVVFWLSLTVCFYIYFGYPALLYGLSRVRARAIHHREFFPPVSIIVAVYNEEKFIQQKIENALSVDYPGPIELVIASDGSTDRTIEIASAYRDRARILELERRGKAFALNDAARVAAGEILIFTDATVLFDPQAIRHLVSAFGDPEVGGVCGNKKFLVGVGADATEKGENLYVRYDQWQKKLESEIGSVFAADGTLYAVRRELFVPIADPAQADDIAISARVVLGGKRLVYEPRAIAWEEAPVEGSAEFRRKVRVTNHSVRALLNLGSALWTRGFYSVELLSHKLFRHFIPFFLIPLLAANFFLAIGSSFFFALLLLQGLFYLLAITGAVFRGTEPGRLKVLAVPYYFCLVNAAAFLGVLSILRRDRLQAWAPRGGLS